MLDDIIKKIKKDFKDSPDIIYRKVKVKNKEILLIYNISTSSSNNINDFLLGPLMSFNKDLTRENILNHLENVLPETVIENANEKDLYSKISSGFTAVFLENEKPFVIETKADLSRGVAEPLTENSISGPKDAFGENYQTNIGLIRKRIKTNDLTLEELSIGKDTKTQVAIFYMDSLIEKSLLNDIKKKLENVNINAVLDSTYLREVLSSRKSSFPTIITTERPDTASMQLLDGKILIMVENSPYLLIIPSFFTDLFNASEDNYGLSINVSFTKIIRYLSFFIAIFLPAFYIAITTYDHEAIPVTLLINFSSQRASVPFPIIIEALGLTLVFEILRESDIRMPHLSGSAISILGAIVLGDAAVAAGIVSPIMVIVVSLSAIASLMFSNIAMVNAIRIWKIIFMIMASLAGTIGIFASTIFLIVHLSSLHTLGKPYLYPFVPFNKDILKQSLIKVSLKKQKRSFPIKENNL